MFVDYCTNTELTGFSLFQKKGLQAISAIYTGECILEEQPLLCSQFLWNAEYKYAACEFCLAPLETAEENVRRLSGDPTVSLPFTEQCCPTNKSAHVSCTCGVLFCTPECRQRAWDLYHRSLCPSEPSNASTLGQSIEKLCNFWKTTHYPPETASIMLLVKILAAIKQSPSPMEMMAKVNEFTCSMGNSEEMIRKLLGEKYNEQIVNIRQMVGEIVFDPSLEPFFTDQGFTLLLALIFRHGQSIGTNPFSKWAENAERLVASNPAKCEEINKLVEQLFEKMDQKSGLQFINNEGSGLYATSFHIRHSCDPNSELCFPHNNHVLQVKATTSIEPGEEITVCYLDECMQSSSRHTRVKYLQENYSFTCHCRKCESQIGQPDVTSDEEEEDSSDGEVYSDDDMNCD